MKYIVYIERVDLQNEEHLKRIRDIAQNKLPELQKTKDFPKPLSPAYRFPNRSTFRLYEAENAEQIANYCGLWDGLLLVEWVPIIEGDIMREAVDKYRTN